MVFVPPRAYTKEVRDLAQDPLGPTRADAGLCSVSKDPTPAFALLQVKEEDLEELSLTVQNAVWEDSKGTFTSPSLVGPPHVERSVYKKIPTGKPKKDPKEGTIDQDEEFKAFLASLAVDPTSKTETEDAPEEVAAETDSKTVITPLVAALIEKRAKKAKEAAEAKSNKHSRQDSHGGKGKASAVSTEEPKKKSKDKSEKPKETVKILKKQAATAAAAEAAKAVAKEIKGGASTSETGSRRAVPKGIHAILKRDLGIEKKESSKKADAVEKTKDAKGSENGTSNATGSNTTATTEATPTPTAPKVQPEKSSRGSRRRGKESKSVESKPSGSSETTAPAAPPASAAAAPPPKAPIILQKKKDDSATSISAKDAATTSKPSSKSANTSSAAAATPAGPKASTPKGGQAGGSKKSNSNNSAAPSSGSTRAFLKHANQSQGITEPLLKESMEKFGSIRSIEIDRRKGFAYVEFADHSGLSKAMAASPVSIASGAVQVLERKDQAPKKAAATTNNTTQAQATVAKDTSAPAAAPAPAAPSKTAAPASASAEKSSGEQSQQPKRSRRRGRGRGGNGGGGGNSDKKQDDQGGPGGAGPSSTPVGGEASGGG